MSTNKNPSTKRRTWSLFLGIAIISLSLWALHHFCDGYSESIGTQPVRGRMAETSSALMPAGPVCERWLGAITLTAGFGVGCLLVAWLLNHFAISRAPLRLAAALAVIGRLIALGSLGTVLLVVVLYSQFSDAV